MKGEAHHLNVKSACRRLCACGAKPFRAGSPTFRKNETRKHILLSKRVMMCFLFLHFNSFAEYVPDCKARNLREGTIHHYEEYSVGKR